MQARKKKNNNNNTTKAKLCIKICIKSYVIIHITMSDNTHNKSYQLKLNDINYYVYCHMRFDANFNTLFVILNIIKKKKKLFEIILHFSSKK